MAVYFSLIRKWIYPTELMFVEEHLIKMPEGFGIHTSEYSTSVSPYKTLCPLYILYAQVTNACSQRN